MALPAMLLPALSIGSTVGGALMGGAQAKRQAREAARREKYNQMMDGLNTRSSVFGGGPTHRMGEMDAGPGAMAGAMLGGMGGLQTGLNVYGGIKNMGLGKTMGDVVAPQAAQQAAYLDPRILQQQSGQGAGGMGNAYSSMRMMG